MFLPGQVKVFGRLNTFFIFHMQGQLFLYARASGVSVFSTVSSGLEISF